MKILLTGFGPFPGARLNPTAALVRRLASQPPRAGERRAAHVFETTYAAVDRELPLMLAQEKPAVLIMFGLAARSRELRVETVARNAMSRAAPDAAGYLPLEATIAAVPKPTLPMRVPSHRLLQALQRAGVNARLSRDAGRYLCNYLCWQATAAATAAGGPRLAAFVHVPRVGGAGGRRGAPLTFNDLVRAGEAVIAAAVATARSRR